MEERVSPAGDGNDDPPLESNDRHPRTPGKSTETYVIQIPRDQVYRVPPPENAQIVESYRSPMRDNKSKCGKRWIFIFLAIIIIGIGILFFTLTASSKPKSPEFSITYFNKKNSKSSDHHSNPEYEISLLTSNPNEKMDVHYGVGNVTLNFKGHKIANGGCPLIEQGGGKSNKVDEKLNGINYKALPSWIEESLNDKFPKVLILKIDVPIEIKSWAKKVKKEVIVGCDLQVNTLAEGAKILSQKCETDF
ncbi:hypothetical protein ACH5RR_012414 [Cinchona calisaya]|uniref:Late embryogenesis abundant protein LEA-2 subgroup domain-containing protein n=1 Tax=Cinchona calisaya TaxID=153742 RepID=A0ABD3A880_9GENT